MPLIPRPRRYAIAVPGRHRTGREATAAAGGDSLTAPRSVHYPRHRRSGLLLIKRAAAFPGVLRHARPRSGGTANHMKKDAATMHTIALAGELVTALQQVTHIRLRREKTATERAI